MKEDITGTCTWRRDDLSGSQGHEGQVHTGFYSLAPSLPLKKTGSRISQADLEIVAMVIWNSWSSCPLRQGFQSREAM